MKTKTIGILKGFCTLIITSGLLFCTPVALAVPDIEAIHIQIAKHWRAGTLPAEPFSMWANIYGDDITSVTVTSPLGTTSVGELQPERWKVYFGEYYPTLGALRADFPTGDYVFIFNEGEDSVTLHTNPVEPTGFAEITYPTEGSTDVPLDPTFTWESCLGYGDSLFTVLGREDDGTWIYSGFIDIAQTNLAPGLLLPGLEHHFDLTVIIAQRYNFSTTMGDSFLYFDDFHYANEVHFTTTGGEEPPVNVPIVSTSPATDVTKSSAMLKGVLIDDGGEACQYRFRYRDDKSDYLYTSWTGSVIIGESFSEHISDLRHNKTYYFNAQARNSAGESDWGDEESFVTFIPKEFMITFDDGPIPGQTDSILLQLMNCRVDGKPVRAAFFMVGDPDPLYYAWYDLEWNKGSVQQYPAAARRVAGFGHSVGNHTQHHAWFPQWWLPDFGFKSIEDFVADEVSKCNTAIENALRENPTDIFRAPYLQEKECPSEIQKGVKKSKLNLKIVSGEIADISDLVFPPPTVTDVQNKARGILESWGEDEPVVLIFHDNRSVTYNHIGEIITYLQNKGYRLVHFDCDDIPQQTMGD